MTDKVKGFENAKKCLNHHITLFISSSCHYMCMPGFCSYSLPIKRDCSFG